MQDSELTTVMMRYYLTADYLFFDLHRLVRSDVTPDPIQRPLERFVKVAMWCSTVFVLIEGWRKWKLSNPVVDTMLQDEKVDLLRQFRNKTFHAEPEVVHEAQRRFLDAVDSMDWIYSLRRAIGIVLMRRQLDENFAKTGLRTGLTEVCDPLMFRGLDRALDVDLPPRSPEQLEEERVDVHMVWPWPHVGF